MDLMARLRAWALARPRVLLVDAPGAGALRWAVEAEMDRRGWTPARAPADSDLLIVLGAPGRELTAAVEVLWSQVPEPRHRLELRHVDDLGPALDGGRTELIRRSARAVDAHHRPSPTSLLGGNSEADDGGMDDGGMDHGGMDHGSEVAGLPMATSGPDRDGLELDVLAVSLGPVLPGWPTGLVLRADLRGDVLTSAELRWLDAESLPTVQQRLDPRAAALDRLAAFLDVAGWPTAARDARRARDLLAAGVPDRRRRAQRLAESVTRRVRRSRTLAWTAGGLGPGAAGRGSGTDVLDRVRRLCDIASGRPVAAQDDPPLDDVPRLLEGSELGSARLVVAALDLRPVGAAANRGARHA